MNNQLSFFDDEDLISNSVSIEKKMLKDDPISKNIYNMFEEYDFKYKTLTVDLAKIYFETRVNIPKEKVDFFTLPINVALVCELICAAICNNINWDYLRKAILDQVIIDKRWITINHLLLVEGFEIQKLLSEYPKQDKIDCEGRAKILHELAHTYKDNGFESIFLNSNCQPKCYDEIRKSLLMCNVFSQDVLEKKLRLLIMKISNYNVFHELMYECKPTIDYHVIRTFIRRGFLLMKNRSAINFIKSESIHGEKTLAALRKHCENIMDYLSSEIGISIAELNSVEWWVGRSVCTEGEPDCLLNRSEAKWLKNKFDKCPFFDICSANSSGFTQLTLYGFSDEANFNLKEVESPNYGGTSY